MIYLVVLESIIILLPGQTILRWDARVNTKLSCAFLTSGCLFPPTPMLFSKSASWDTHNTALTISRLHLNMAPKKSADNCKPCSDRKKSCNGQSPAPTCLRSAAGQAEYEVCMIDSANFPRADDSHRRSMAQALQLRPLQTGTPSRTGWKGAYRACDGRSWRPRTPDRASYHPWHCHQAFDTSADHQGQEQ